VANRDEFVSLARDWVGVPYRHQGRSRTGVDCIGLAICVAHELRISDFDIDGYGRVPSGRMMARMMRDMLDPVSLADAAPGDLLHMAFSGQPQHIAIMSSADPDRIIHADANIGRVVEHGLDAVWRSRIRGVYRVPV
jgi:cell wall-associated NlpC family hydrolase